MPEAAVYTVEQAAEFLAIGRGAAYAAVRAGEIPAIKIGRRLLVPKARLEAMLGLDNDHALGGQSEREVTTSAGQGRRDGP